MKKLLVILALLPALSWGYHLPSTATETHGPRVPRIKLFRSNPHRFTAINFQGTDPYDAPDDDYICSGTARRPKIIHSQSDCNEDLSDYVLVRLAVARARALERYRQIHG